MLLPASESARRRGYGQIMPEINGAALAYRDRGDKRRPPRRKRRYSSNFPANKISGGIA